MKKTTWVLMVINIHNLVAGDIQHNPSWSLPARGYIFAVNYTQKLDKEERHPSLLINGNLTQNK